MLRMKFKKEFYCSWFKTHILKYSNRIPEYAPVCITLHIYLKLGDRQVSWAAHDIHPDKLINLSTFKSCIKHGSLIIFDCGKCMFYVLSQPSKRTQFHYMMTLWTKISFKVREVTAKTLLARHNRIIYLLTNSCSNNDRSNADARNGKTRATNFMVSYFLVSAHRLCGVKFFYTHLRRKL